MPFYLRILLSLLSSILAALAFPPFGYWPLALIAWLPLFISIRGINAKPAFYLGLLHGFTLYALTLHWMWNIFSASSILLWLVMALFIGICCAMTASLKSKKFKAILATCTWVALEWIRIEYLPIHHASITPGMAMPPSLLSPIIGTYGVSFLMVFTSCLLAFSPKINHYTTYLAVLSLAGIYTSTLVLPPAQQGNIPILAIQNQSNSPQQNIQLTQQALEQNQPHQTQSGFILWPEISINDLALDRAYLRRDLFQFSDTHPHTHILGTYTQASPENNTKHNSALTLHQSTILGTHHKNHPSPLYKDATKGTLAEAIDSPLGRIATPISTDCHHQSTLRKFISSGAEALLIPSLDHPHWSNTQHLQHAQLFRHRAAENHRWIAVASHSGITQIIDPSGHQIQTLTPTPNNHILTGHIATSNKLTPYHSYGYFISYLALAGAIIALLTILIQHPMLAQFVARK